jgi:hypothetical protein|nr:MAG TPA: protein of unknown function (DUF4201) [Caudoviricetes sp.]DAP80827.1 MAG TPA: protein of unknown function (DUF4201) [Caudoviricetes sp.]
MEIEQVKQKHQQLSEEIAKKNDDLNNIKKSKANLESDLNVVKENIATAEQVIFDKREELKKLEIAIEVMSR